MCIFHIKLFGSIRTPVKTDLGGVVTFLWRKFNIAGLVSPLPPCGWRPEENDVWTSACQEVSLQGNYRLLCEQIHRFSHFRDAKACGRQENLAVCVDSFQPSAQEKDITLLDFIGISERLGGAASVSDDACWEVKRRERSWAESAGKRSKAPFSLFIPHR